MLSTINERLTMLELELDSLEGVDEQYHSLYVENEGKFVFTVPEKVDVDGLKKTVKAVRNERDDFKKTLARLKAESEEKENNTLVEKEQYKELWEKEKDLNQGLRGELTETQKKTYADKIVSRITTDPKKAKFVESEILKNIDLLDGNLNIVGIAGVETSDQLVEHFREQYPFFVDGSKASGGGSTGSKGEMPHSNLKTLEEFNKLSPVEKMEYNRKTSGRFKE